MQNSQRSATRRCRETYDDWKDAFRQHDWEFLAKQFDLSVFAHNKRLARDPDAFERALRDSLAEKRQEEANKDASRENLP